MEPTCMYCELPRVTLYLLYYHTPIGPVPMDCSYTLEEICNDAVEAHATALDRMGMLLSNHIARE